VKPPDALNKLWNAQDESRRGEMRRFLRFTGAGIIAAAANIGSRVVFSRFLPYAAAVAAAYLVGMIVAFSLSRLFVFESGANTWRKELLRFSLVNALAFVQVWVVSLLLANWLFPKFGFSWHREAVAHIIGVGSPIILSYFGHKHFSFRA
jgi:putative flippase GtrA